MAGIYLHIPFCRKICGYCDFFKNASLRHKADLLKAMQKEILLQKEYLNEAVETVYFGGGTPSVLEKDEIAQLLATIGQNFTLTKHPEITFEANPDDLTVSYLKNLKELGINRLSIGIQSFDDIVLQFMNRRHSAQEAIHCVQTARTVGFENLSLDIIYGVPNTNLPYLEKNLQQLCSLKPVHISAYHLTIEQGTPFAHLKKKGKLKEIADKNSQEQYDFLVQYLQEQGYEQYEISNFCKDGTISQHNTNYWTQRPYLGIGPSAHSYDKASRHWNVSNLKKYITTIEQGKLPSEQEILSKEEQFNDYIMVRLRTKWGIDMDYIQKKFGEKFRENILQIVAQHKQDFVIQLPHIYLKPKAFLRSDYLIAKFFVI